MNSRMNFLRTVGLSFIFVLFTLLCIGNAAAFQWDWGGAFDNTTGYVSTGDGDFSQENRLTLWAIGEEQMGRSNLSFAAQGYYLFTDERPYLFDIDALSLTGRFPGLLGSSSVVETSAGRFPFSDPTGYILNHNADGARLNLLFPRIRIRADAAYTGLLLNPSSDIRISSDDFSEKSDEEDNVFGPKRFFTQGQISFIDLGRLNRWVFYGLAQFDMRDQDDANETINSQYWGTLMSFKFGRNFYYDGFLTVGTSQIDAVDESDKLSLLTGFNSRYLREDWLASNFTLYGLLATPDAPVEDMDIGFDMPFGLMKMRPMNKPSLGLVVDPTLDSLIHAGFSYSLRPFLNGGSEMMGRFQPKAGARAYFRVYKWSADWMALDQDTTSWFLGTEYDLGFTWRILSDLSTGLTTAFFVPGSAWSKDDDSRYMLRLEVSASF